MKRFLFLPLVFITVCSNVVDGLDERKLMRYLVRCSFLFTLLLFPTLISVCQQTSERQSPASPPEANTQWQTFGFAEGRFSIQFPGTPEVSTTPLDSSGQIVSHKYSVATRAEYAVTYADYTVKLDGVDAANKVLDDWSKSAIAASNSELLSTNKILLGESPGRELKARMKDGAIARMKIFVVGQRLYQVAVILPRLENAPPEEVTLYDQAASKFLNSFKLPRSSGLPWPTEACKGSASGASDVGMLNGHALKLGRPAYPDVARAAHAQGRVVVQVLIDPTGKVIDAQAVSGHPLLYAASVAAARQSLFSPTILSGRTVCVTGIITFNFVFQSRAW